MTGLDEGTKEVLLLAPTPVLRDVLRLVLAELVLRREYDSTAQALDLFRRLNEGVQRRTAP
jgi:hypothetical protein